MIEKVTVADLKDFFGIALSALVALYLVGTISGCVMEGDRAAAHQAYLDAKWSAQMKLDCQQRYGQWVDNRCIPPVSR